MRIFYSILFFIFMTNFAFSENLKVKYFDNFYLKDSVNLEDKINLFLIKNMDEFNNYVFPFPLMYKRIKVPNFEEENLVLMVLPADNKEVFIDIKAIERKNKYLFVKYDLKSYDIEIPFKITPIKIFSIPKKIVKRIYFSQDEIRYDYLDINNQKD